MNRKTRTLLLLALFALFIAVAVFAYNTLGKDVLPGNIADVAPSEGEAAGSAEPAGSEQEASGSDGSGESEKTKAPDFTVTDGAGDPVKLSDLAGKPVVLNFWASWCPPCNSEMPEFDEAYAEIGEDVSFMMVDLVDGQRETKETGTQYIEEQGFSFPVYFDTEQEAAYAYGITSIPTTIFIDKEGYVVTSAQGAIDAETLRQGIAAITK
ncbi:MAG: TlpA family protein disulfide reductase [Clostridiales Family XIII bacterium]|jgi:thiol-disulfide isomerase/thioredoxin|nr:TlpA family protein disulfide reductase [Clostridiales Family XIII bacterium]